MKKIQHFIKDNMALSRIEDYNKKLPIVELYTCVQSEGSRAGRPTVAIRTTGCTHRCYFGEGGWCDSWYTSIHPEKGKYTFQDIVNIYNEHPEITEMMLTGGSPTMHPALVNELTHFAHERGIIITIETEGSHFLETDYPIGLISFSPKFSNSVPVLGVLTPQGSVTDQKMIDKHNSLRLNKDAIKKSMEYHSDYHMKVVVNPTEDPETWNEIKSFLDELEVPKNKIWIMPPGDNRQELIRVYPMVIDWCTKNYYNFTGREHIIAFDTKREV
jgi:7-carboxy-7-deazaguanine synthase